MRGAYVGPRQRDTRTTGTRGEARASTASKGNGRARRGQAGRRARQPAATLGQRAVPSLTASSCGSAMISSVSVRLRCLLVRRPAVTHTNDTFTHAYAFTQQGGKGRREGSGGVQHTRARGRRGRGRGTGSPAAAHLTASIAPPHLITTAPQVTKRRLAPTLLACKKRLPSCPAAAAPT